MIEPSNAEKALTIRVSNVTAKDVEAEISDHSGTSFRSLTSSQWESNDCTDAIDRALKSNVSHNANREFYKTFRFWHKFEHEQLKRFKKKKHRFKDKRNLYKTIITTGKITADTKMTTYYNDRARTIKAIKSNLDSMRIELDRAEEMRDRHLTLSQERLKQQGINHAKSRFEKLWKQRYAQKQDENGVPLKEDDESKGKPQQLSPSVSKMVDYLHRENERLRKKCEEKATSCDLMQEKNATLMEEALVTKQSIEDLIDEIVVTEKANSKLEQELNLCTREMSKVQSDYEQAHKFYQAENHACEIYEEELGRIVPYIDEQYDDPDLIQDVKALQFGMFAYDPVHSPFLPWAKYPIPDLINFKRSGKSKSKKRDLERKCQELLANIGTFAQDATIRQEQNEARDMRLARKAATTPKEYKVPTSIEFVKTQDDSTTSFETVPELDDSAAATMPRPDYEEALKTPSQRPRKLLKKVYPQSPGGDTVETAITGVTFASSIDVCIIGDDDESEREEENVRNAPDGTNLLANSVESLGRSHCRNLSSGIDIVAAAAVALDDTLPNTKKKANKKKTPKDTAPASPTKSPKSSKSKEKKVQRPKSFVKNRSSQDIVDVERKVKSEHNLRSTKSPKSSKSKKKKLHRPKSFKNRSSQDIVNVDIVERKAKSERNLRSTKSPKSSKSKPHQSSPKKKTLATAEKRVSADTIDAIMDLNKGGWLAGEGGIPRKMVRFDAPDPVICPSKPSSRKSKTQKKKTKTTTKSPKKDKTTKSPTKKNKKKTKTDKEKKTKEKKAKSTTKRSQRNVILLAQ